MIVVGGLARYEIKDTTAVVTIDHPPMNALDVPTKETIGNIFKELDKHQKQIRNDNTILFYGKCFQILNISAHDCHDNGTIHSAGQKSTQRNISDQSFFFVCKIGFYHKILLVSERS